MSRVFRRAVLFGGIVFSALPVFGAGSDFRIGFLFSDLREAAAKGAAAAFRREAGKLGFVPVIEDAGGDAKAQRKKFKELLDSGVSALVIEPVDSKGAAALVESARLKKKPVVSFGKLIEEAPVDAFVSSDYFQGGVRCAEAAIEATNKKGDYVILMGPAGDRKANEITDGFLHVLTRHPGVKIVGMKNHDDWSRSVANSTVEEILERRNGKVDAVLANSAALSKGAAEVVGRRGRAGQVHIGSVEVTEADLAALARTAADAAFTLARRRPLAATETVKNGRYQVLVLRAPIKFRKR